MLPPTQYFISFQLLSQHGPTASMINSGWPIIGQFSSIGSLGSTSSQWLTGEWLASLSSTRGASITIGKTAKLHLVCDNHFSLAFLVMCVLGVSYC